MPVCVKQTWPKRLASTPAQLEGWESEKARPSDDHVSTVEDSLGLRRGEILIAAGLVGPTAIESARGELAHTVGARFERLTPKQKQLLLGILDEFEARSE
jgi:hypothetical protein